MVALGLCFGAIALLCIAFENLGATTAFFGIAALLFYYA
jgi:hypothetical protein